jgi:predicted transcriptional regulator
MSTERKRGRGRPVRLYDFGVLLIVAVAAAVVAALVLNQVAH